MDIRERSVDDALEVVEDALDRRRIRVDVVAEGVARGWPKAEEAPGKVGYSNGRRTSPTQTRPPRVPARRRYRGSVNPPDPGGCPCSPDRLGWYPRRHSEHSPPVSAARRHRGHGVAGADHDGHQRGHNNPGRGPTGRRWLRLQPGEWGARRYRRVHAGCRPSCCGRAAPTCGCRHCAAHRAGSGGASPGSCCGSNSRAGSAGTAPHSGSCPCSRSCARAPSDTGRGVCTRATYRCRCRAAPTLRYCPG